MFCVLMMLREMLGILPELVRYLDHLGKLFSPLNLVWTNVCMQKEGTSMSFEAEDREW